jgi:sugar phosphate isomerase/epimerase
MNARYNRRTFIKQASLLSLCAAAGGPLAEAAAAGNTLKVSLNAYSFNKLLNDAIRERGPGITLLGVLDFAAKCKFDGFDATGYYFPNYPRVPTDAYIKELKSKAAALGVGISGTGVRNNFTTADKTVRDAGVKHIKEFVEVAAKLGAPVVRVFADTQMRAQTWETVSAGCTRDQVQEWIAGALRECADHGRQFGIYIGVQNHGDFLKTGDQLMALIGAVGSDWCRPIVDTGYFKTPDPYADMAVVAPKAINWQIKQSPFGEESEVPTDLIKLLHIIRKSGYSGYLPIETLSPKGKPYDPFTVVPAFQQKLIAAIKQTA